MKIEIQQCVVDGESIMLIAKFKATFESLIEENKSSYRYEGIQRLAENAIANSIADEFLKKHKMDIVTSINKDDIVNGIQLKMIEQFALGKH